MIANFLGEIMVTRSLVVCLLLVAVGCSKKDIGPIPSSMAKAKVNVKKSQSKLNSKNQGGQPGEIILTGALVDSNENRTVDNVEVNLQTGKGITGDHPGIEVEKLKLSPGRVLYKNYLKKAFISLGCVISKNEMKSLKGHTQTTVAQVAESIGDNAISVKVDRIYICGNVSVPHNKMFIHANSIYMNKANFELIGTEGVDYLNIETARLTVNNENVIVSKQPDSSDTREDAPKIVIKVGELDGRGKLNVESYGSNYKP